MNILENLNSAYNLLSEYSFRESIAVFLGEGFKFENCKQYSFTELFSINPEAKDLSFPEIYLKRSGARDIFFVSGKFPVGNPGNLYTYMLFETIKNLGINHAILQGGCSFIDTCGCVPELFIAEDYLVSDSDVSRFFTGLEEIIDLPEYLSPYECINREFIKLAELTAINHRIRHRKGNIYYKSSKIIENPCEIRFLTNNGLDAVTFSPASHLFFSALSNLNILQLFIVLNQCCSDQYSTFQPEMILMKKNDFMPVFISYIENFISDFFEGS